MKSLNEVISSKINGMYYGNRVILPFSVHLLKIVIENDIITDFGPGSKGAYVAENDDFMEIYFNDYKDLFEVITKYENIKMIVVEKGKDVFDFKNHIKIALHPEEKHKLVIEKLSEDTIFID